MDYIKTKKRKGIIKLGILDEDDKPILDENGKEVYLEFDLEDIDLPFKYNRAFKSVNEAKRKLKDAYIIIDKKKDVKRKNSFLSVNEEAKMKALKQFYLDMEKAIDLFLGDGGTKKYLNGRNPYFEMFDDISEAIEPFLPKMKLTLTDMKNRIANKYKLNKGEDVIDDT